MGIVDNLDKYKENLIMRVMFVLFLILVLQGCSSKEKMIYKEVGGVRGSTLPTLYAPKREDDSVESLAKAYLQCRAEVVRGNAILRELEKE